MFDYDKQRWVVQACYSPISPRGLCPVDGVAAIQVIIKLGARRIESNGASTLQPHPRLPWLPGTVARK